MSTCWFRQLLQSSCGLLLGVSVSPSKEVSHRIRNMPYDVSGHPKHPSIQLLVTHCLTVKHSHAAGSQKRPFTCFNLNPWCVQHIYQSVTERSPSDKLFFSLVAGAIPQTSCQTVLLFFTFYAHMKVVYIKRIFKFPYVTNFCYSQHCSKGRLVAYLYLFFSRAVFL